MNRLYAIESTPTLTGAKADHRLALRASEIEAAAQALSTGRRRIVLERRRAEIHRRRGQGSPGPSRTFDRHRRRLPAGRRPPARARAQSVARQHRHDHYRSAGRLAQRDGPDRVVARSDPGDGRRPGGASRHPRFESGLHGAGGLQIPGEARQGRSLGFTRLHVDDTATHCHWNLPLAHPLESWGDARAYDGTVTVMQPLIAPLYEGRAVPEVLAAFIEAQSGKTAHDLVKDYWTRAHGGEVAGWTITDPTGQPFKSADSFWKHVLHDGWIAGTGAASGEAARREPPVRRGSPASMRRLRHRCRPSASSRIATPRRPPERRPRDHLQAGSHDLGRPLREQRLASGTAEAADEDHVGSRPRGSARGWPNRRACATATSSSCAIAATPRSCRSRSCRAIPTTR